MKLFLNFSAKSFAFKDGEPDYVLETFDLQADQKLLVFLAITLYNSSSETIFLDWDLASLIAFLYS